MESGPKRRQTTGETKSWRERNRQMQLEGIPALLPSNPGPSMGILDNRIPNPQPLSLTALWPLSKAPSHWAWALGSAKPWLHSLLRKGVINPRHTWLPHLQNQNHCNTPWGS